MTTQFFVLNMTHHKMILKTHKPHTLKWLVEKHDANSLGLPIDATRDTKYKVKINGQVVIEIYLDNSGQINKIIHLSKKFYAKIDHVHHHHLSNIPPYRENKDGSVSWMNPCRPHLAPVILIVEN